MKNFKLKRLFSLALIGGLSALSASTVFAAAGVTISNTATLNFDVGGVAQTAVVSPSADFVEDRKINFTVAEVDGATTTVIPGALLQVQTFTVTNNGNAPQDFLLSALEVGGNAFSPTPVQVFVDSAAVAGGADAFASATDTDIFIDELLAGTARTVYIVSTIPAGATNGQVATMSLVAQIAAGGAASADDSVAANAGAAIVVDDNAHFSPAGIFSNGNTDTTAAVTAAVGTVAIVDDPATEQIVFADAAGTLNSAGAADAASNGQHSANDTYTVNAAALTVDKTVAALWDPINGGTNPKAIPGAYVQYSIAVANTGPASASLTTLSDTLVTTLLDPNLVISTVADATAPTVAETEHGTILGFGIKVVVTDTNANGRLVTTFYCTGDTSGDTDTDGCSYPGDAPAISSDIGVNLAKVLPVDAGDGGDAYTVGELKAGETVTITFNAIVQ